MVRLVTPMGTTSNTHQVAANRKHRQRPLAFRRQGEGFALGIDGIRPGRRIVNDDENKIPMAINRYFFQPSPIAGKAAASLLIYIFLPSRLSF
jgi:hypothetical protein